MEISYIVLEHGIVISEFSCLCYPFILSFRETLQENLRKICLIIKPIIKPQSLIKTNIKKICLMNPFIITISSVFYIFLRIITLRIRG